MSHLTAPRNRSAHSGFLAWARGLIRVAAIGAILAIAVHPAAASAAGAATDTDRTVAGAGIFFGGLSAVDCGNFASPAFDDGEDRFDEGDDEDGDACAVADDDEDGQDECLDDGEDRFDEGDDEYLDTAADDDCDGGCDNFDDGEDRCLDDGEDRFDEGDDEFDVAPSQIAPSAAVSSEPSQVAAVTPDLPVGLAGIAGAIGLGLGGLYLIRRLR